MKSTDLQTIKNENTTNNSSVTQNQDEDQQKVPTATSSLITYMPPFWSASPSENKEKYFLEVIKEGTIIDTIQLGQRPYYLIGRAPICDIVAEHPVISRLIFFFLSFFFESLFVCLFVCLFVHYFMLSLFALTLCHFIVFVVSVVSFTSTRSASISTKR
jgi:hypothetical protein